MSNKSFFNIELLPATYGDCLWIEFGDSTKTNRILIDGGPVNTYPAINDRLMQVASNERTFELVVLTHVDADHVEGLVRLFANKPLPFAVKKVWFNGWRQMKAAHGLLGPEQGEFLSALLVERAPYAWKPDAKPWVVPDQGALPTFELPGGMKLTLLSPSVQSLDKMAKEWGATLAKAKKQRLTPGDLEAAWEKLSTQKKFLPVGGLLGVTPDLDDLLANSYPADKAAPNGSSIAFLAEFSGKSALFLADAHPTVIAASLERLCVERGIERLYVNAVKVSHHGSKGNTTPQLLNLIESPRYLISSSGDKFSHPDKECIALIIREGQPERLYFNYRTEFTETWLTEESQAEFQYEAVVREDAAPTLAVNL